MALIRLHDVQLGFGGPLLLEGLNLSIEKGERICLLGRNGSGKSTLMKVITGEMQPDDGEVSKQPALVVARLAQEVPDNLSGSVFDVVSTGLGDLGKLVRRYHQIGLQLAADTDVEQLKLLSKIQHELETADGWQTEQRVEAVLSQLSLDPDIEFKTLSGGLKRRVLLAQALVQAPDLLLLDEPTNHLDIESIDWLERLLLGYRKTLLFVTHDRVFLRRLATRIIELDAGNLTDWPGDYDNFLRRKEELLNAQQRANERFDKKLAQEEIWIRQGIKARRTRNEGRVRQLLAMRKARGQRRERCGQTKITLQEADRSGKLVVEAEKIDYAWQGRPVIRAFSTTILRGDRIGIIGPNGVGKTTLLNILLGRLEPDLGKMRFGTNLQVAYFDQLRSTLEDDRTVMDNLADGGDRITVNDKSRHVIGYLEDFLFTPDRARQPVKVLSGGERNRLLLAKLFARPSNVVVMDEPTNDLDVETLELLEERLMKYEGTLLMVSHDRAFLNNVVTSTLVFEGQGKVIEYVGGYDDWLRQRPDRSVAVDVAQRVKIKSNSGIRDGSVSKTKKLSYKDQRELDLLPLRIEALESELEEIREQMSDAEFYRRESTEIAATNQRLTVLEEALAEAYHRWEVLERVD